MTNPHAPHARHTVVVVDDEEPFLELQRGLLTRAGFQVWTAQNAAQAFALLEEHVPCLVVADVMMPGVSGFEICRRIKQDPRIAHVPVVLVSGRTEEADVEEGIAAGAADYIKKPFDRDEFRMRVQTQVRLHEARMEQQRLNNHLSVISAAAKDAIVMIDDSGAISHWNEAAETMFGYARHEVLGADLHALLTPARFLNTQQLAFPRFQATGQGGVVGQTVELAAMRKSGDEFPIELSLSTAKVDGAWCAVGIVRDISERKRMEDALRQSEEQHRILFDASRDALMTLSPPSWRFTTCNPATAELFGVAGTDEFCALGPWEVSPERQPDGRLSADAAKAMIEEACLTGVAHFEWTHQRIDGTAFPADVLLTRMEHGHQAFLQATVRDLSERKRMETELGIARKLEAVGQLAAGIAHEINTPTQYVGDSVHFLRESFAGVTQVMGQYRRAVDVVREAGRHEDLIREIGETETEVDLAYLESNVPDSFRRCLDGIERISTIVLAMKEFAHADQREQTAADLNQALRSTLVIASNEYKYVADIETDLGELPPVLCHLGDLNQVFLNLIVNAAHAIRDVVVGTGAKGLIRVTTRHEGESVRIEISDTGSGIPASIRHRIFEPFFTTKDVGKGSGQGLAIARSIVVNNHHGTLTFDTQPGAGTTFTIRLPIGGIRDGRAEESR